MDSDLLDIYLHADEINPAGVRALVSDMQRERDTVRFTLGAIQEQCLKLQESELTVSDMEDALRGIDVFINELENTYELGHHISWRELASRE